MIFIASPCLPSFYDPFWSNWALVLVGVGAAWIAVGTLKDIKRQTNFTEQALLLTHRPKIIVRNIVIRGLAKLDRKTPMDQWSTQLSGYYTVANVGGLPSTIQKVIEGVWAEKGLPMERPDRENVGRALNILLNPGESTEINFSATLSTDDACEIIDQEFQAYLLIQIDYVDKSKTIRKTSACRHFDPLEKRFRRVEDADYEYSD